MTHNFLFTSAAQVGLFHRTAMQEKHAADKHLFSFKWITWHLFAALWGKPLCWFAELKWVSEVFAKSSCSSQLKRKPVRATLANTPSNTTLSLTTCFIKKVLQYCSLCWGDKFWVKNSSDRVLLTAWLTVCELQECCMLLYEWTHAAAAGEQRLLLLTLIICCWLSACSPFMLL